MVEIQFDKYRDRWVLTSAEQVIGGPTLDVPPVRILDHGDVRGLAEALRILASEHRRQIPQPDLNDPYFTIGIRPPAVGAKSWRAYVRSSRAFFLEAKDGNLVLSEWPREGDSFSANATWQRTFTDDHFEAVAKCAIEVTGG